MNENELSAALLHPHGTLNKINKVDSSFACRTTAAVKKLFHALPAMKPFFSVPMNEFIVRAVL
jgi:hypothetical protein